MYSAHCKTLNKGGYPHAIAPPHPRLNDVPTRYGTPPLGPDGTHALLHPPPFPATSTSGSTSTGTVAAVVVPVVLVFVVPVLGLLVVPELVLGMRWAEVRLGM